ncbi:MAG: hypothetical protein DRR42_21415 [Gammaproteobacteria bacterium]|nr:MAG: hypothetical protein DRR42_21415 [Gammaproteobacteria bacterium]
MLSRRLFIKSAVAANASMLTAPSQAVQLAFNSAQDIPLLVFADDKAVNSKNFIAHVTNDVSGIELDIGQHFDTLRKFCRESPNGQVIGLTRASDCFVLEQVAKDFGFYVHYSASHSYSGNILTHEISTSAASAARIASSLKNAGEYWPRWLAGNMGVLPRENAQSITIKNQVVVPDTPGHEFLVSWSLGT